MFFAPLNQSPTDRPEHFAHANTARSLLAIWLAGADLSRERTLVRALGLLETPADAAIPPEAGDTRVSLSQGAIYLRTAERLYKIAK